MMQVAARPSITHTLGAWLLCAICLGCSTQHAGSHEEDTPSAGAERSKRLLEEKVDAIGAKIRSEPDACELYSERALLYMAMKAYEDAVGDLTTALRLCPDSTVFYYRRAMANNRLGKAQDAAEDATECVTRDSSAFDCYMLRYEVLLALGDSVAAASDLERARTVKDGDGGFRDVLDLDIE